MKKRLLFLWLMLLTMGFGGFAQTTITIGTGTDESYYVPFYNFDKNSWTEMIYPASLINESGYITSIAFYASTVPSTSTYMFNTLTIYMGTTSDTAHGTTSSWMPMTALTEVYSDVNMPVPTTTGWVIFDLDNPFQYDGTQNLVIAISKTMPAYCSSLKFRYTVGPANCCMYRGSDSSTDYANHPGSNTGTSTPNRPNLQLTLSDNADFCHSVSNPTVSEITSNSATVSWTAPADASSYILQYKTSDQDWEDGDINIAYPTEATYNLTGLDPNTQYQVRVASVCATGNSNWKTTSLKTECVAISVAQVPYYEQFEGYASNAFPDCWTRIAGYNSYPYISNASATAHGGTGYLYLYNNASNPIYMALPQFVEDLSTLRLSFWMKPVGTTNYYGRVDLGLMADLSDTTTFVPLNSWSAVGIGSTNWAYYEMNLDTLVNDGTGYLAFRRYVEGTSTYGWYFDDVKVMPIPSCEAPTQLASSTSTPYSVTLGWNPGEESVFKVYYKAVGGESYSSIPNVSLDADNTFELTNLMPATTYSIYVASVCGDGSETPCDPILCNTSMVPATLPYTTDFGADADQDWLLNNGTCANYWVMGAIPDTTVNALYITTNGTTPGYNVSSISVVSAAKLFTIGDDEQYQISFDVMIGGESSYDYLKLFFAPENVDFPAATTAPTWAGNSYSTNAFDFSDYMSASTSTSDIAYKFNLTDGNVVHIDAIMPNPNETPNANSTAQVVFVWKNDNSSGTQPAVIISNVSIAPVTCFRPENVNVSELGAHSAEITWDEGYASTWTVEYGPHGFTLGEGTQINVAATPAVTLNDLEAATEYDVYVVTLCGDGSESVSTFVSFITECDPIISLPQTWNFDSDLMAGTSSYPLPTCWKRISPSGTTTQYPYSYSSSTNAHSGGRVLYFYNYYPNAYAILPEIDVDELDLANMQLSFYAKASTSTSAIKFEVGVMSNPDSASTFTLLQSFTLPTTYSDEPIILPLGAAVGHGRYIAFRNTQLSSTTSSSYYYVDDVTLEEMADCMKPLELTAVPQINQADLSWVNTGGDVDLYYRTEADSEYVQVPAVNLDDNGVYTLTGLVSNMIYYWYLVADCGDTVYTTDVVSFHTPCEGITTLPQTWDFESGNTAGTTTYPLPSCWNRITSPSTTTLYPYVYNSSTNAHNGTRLLYIYNYYPNTFAILPNVDPTVLHINEMMVSFFARLSSTTYNSQLVVGVMSDPANAQTFVPVDTISMTNSYPAEPFEVMFDNYTGNGTFIAFKSIAPSSSSNYTYIDDITLSNIPSCDHPTGLSATAATYSVDLSWDDMTGTYNIYYKADEDTVYTAIQNVVPTDTIYTINNLASSTLYKVYVALICPDGSESATPVLSFTTECAPSMAPFMENFNAASVMPYCWERYSGLAENIFNGGTLTSTTSGWIFTNTNVFGQYHPKINIYGTAAKYWLVSPAIDLTSLTNPALTFDLALTDYNNSDPIESFTAQADDRFLVIISTDDGATWTADNATVWSNDSTGDYVYNQISTTGEEIMIPLEQYAGQTIRIAFYGESTVTSNGDNDLHIDNVAVAEIPSCITPTQLVVSNVTAFSADIAWLENGDATSWVVEYDTAGFTPGTGNVTMVSGTPATTISGLEPSTDYDVYVSADCGAYTSNAITKSFMTPCEGLTTVPQTWNFDENLTAGTSSYPLPECWQRIKAVGTTTLYPYAYSSSTNAHSGARSLYFYNSYREGYAILPGIDNSVLDLTNLQVSFFAKASTENASATLEVGVMTDFTDPTTFTPVASLNLTTSYPTHAYQIPLSPYTGDGTYVAFRNVVNGSVSNYFYIDDVTLEEASSCTSPMNLTVVAASTNSVTLSWISTASAFNLYYRESSETAWQSDNNISLDENGEYSLSGFEEATQYDWYVEAICDVDSVTASEMAHFTTTMAPVGLPYAADFTDSTDTWILNNGSCTNYWARGTLNGTGALFVTQNGTSAGYSTSDVSLVSAEKLFTVGTDSTITIQFDVRVGGESSWDYMKLFLAPATQTFPASTSAPSSSNYGYNSYSQYAYDFYSNNYGSQSSYHYIMNLTGGNTVHVIANMPNPNTNPDADATAKLVFVWKNDGTSGTQPGAIITNVQLGDITCPTPTDLTVSNVSTTSADLSWTENGEATSWNIKVDDGTTENIVMVTTNPYTLTNLTPSSAYTVSVQAACSASDQSLWSSGVAFHTACDAISAPYTEDFNSYLTTATSTTAPSSYPNDELPLCWSFLNRSANSSSYPMAFLSSSTTYAVSGNCLFFKSSSSTPLYAILPDFTDNIQSLTLHFTYRNEGTGSSNGTLSVGYMTDPEDANTFTEVSTFPQITTLTADSVDFSTVPSTASNAYIAFKYTGGSNNNYYLSIDNVGVTSNGSTPVVTDPTVTTTAATNLAQTTATLNATITNPDNVTITAKGFEWKATTGGTYTQIAGAGTGNNFSANLSGLTANTGYTYKAFITFNGTTVYGNEMTFTTLEQGTEPCDVPTGLTADNITKEGFDVSWNANANVSNWNIRYRQQNGQWTSATSNTNQYSITGLSAETNYEVQVQADCGDNNISDWSELLTVTTLVDGINNYLFNSIALYPNPANDVVNVQCTMNNVQLEGIEIIDVYGKVVRTIVGANNYSPIRINVSGLANGMYFVRVTTDEGTVTKTFVKK